MMKGWLVAVLGALLVFVACSSSNSSPDATAPETMAEVLRPPIDVLTVDALDGSGPEVTDVSPVDLQDLLDAGDVGDTLSVDIEAVDVGDPEPTEKSFLLVGGYQEYSFDTKEAGDDVARLVQILRDSGPEFVAAYTTMFDWPYADGQLKVWFRPSGSQRNGDLTAQDLLDVGATAIVESDEATWFKVPLVGLSQLFDNPDITSMNGLEIPKGIDLKPQDGLGAVGMEEALAAIGAPDCHEAGITGQGIRVAVIDGGFKWYQAARDAGLLPADVTLVQDYNFTPEAEMTSAHGTACAEIIHRTAPGAEIFLIPVSHTKLQTPNAVEWCTENGIDVINASWSSFNQSFYDGTGFVSEFVQKAMDAGIVWVNSSGNYGSGEHWYGDWQDADGDGRTEFAALDEENWFTLKEGQGVRIFLRWEGPDAWTTDLDICVTYTWWHFDTPDDKTVSKTCTGGFVGAPKDYYDFGYDNDNFCAKEPDAYNCTSPDFALSIETASGNPLPDGTELQLSMFVDSFIDGQTMSYSMPENSVVDPGVYEGALTVGAINWDQWDSGTPAEYSSFGPTNAGLQKPEVMAPDGITTYNYDNFFGTSASAPFAAGVVALVRELHPGLMPLEVKAKLIGTAIGLADELPHGQTGFGKLHYDCSDCEPECAGLECGPDPKCGEECGTCSECGESCQDGLCVFDACQGKSCGDDGCGGSCGECPVNHDCDVGQCLCKLPLVCGDFCCNDGEVCFKFECCTPDCDGKDCGSDGCGGNCGECGEGTICQEDGTCQACTCEGIECGTNLCGEDCGVCPETHECSNSTCACLLEYTCGNNCCDVTEVCFGDLCCAPDCAGKSCGSDGCGGSCGQCAATEVCDLKGACFCPHQTCGESCCVAGDVCSGGGCCTPDCTDKACGSNGCGGFCGTCPANTACSEGSCQCAYQSCDGTCCAEGEDCVDGVCCAASCDGKECGTDSCGGSCGECAPGESCNDGLCEAKAVPCPKWSRTYTEPDMTYNVYDILPLDSGGYLLGGSRSTADNVNKIWLARTDALGNIQWEKTYGGDLTDAVARIVAIPTGGYYVCATTYSLGAGKSDIWVMRLDWQGKLVWEKLFGASSFEACDDAVRTSDDGLVVLGATHSKGAGSSDIWLLKLSAQGSLQWEKTHGGVSQDAGKAIWPTEDGGFIIAGHNRSKTMTYEGWLLKVNSSGALIWEKTYGDDIEDQKFWGMIPTSSGGYLAVGEWKQGTTFYNQGWVVKVDAAGTTQWEKLFVGPYFEQFYGAVESDSGYILAGKKSQSGPGEWDGWLQAIDKNGNATWSHFDGLGGGDDYRVIRNAGDLFIAAGFFSDEADNWLGKGMVRVFDESGSSECTCGDGLCHGFMAENCTTCPDDCPCGAGEGCVGGTCIDMILVNSADDANDGQCDDAHCSLREALNVANAKAGADTIRFDIPGAGPHVIAMQSALPEVEETVTLDGTSEPDYNGKPAVVIDGGALSNGESGLVILADDSDIKGLAIGGFPGLGMLVAVAENVSVTGCHIGVDAAGTGALSNGSDGLRLNVANNARIGCKLAGCTNILSGNGGDGLEIQQSSGVVVQGNIVGVDATGLVTLGNSETGINFVLATDCTIGGDTLPESNLIGGNGWEGMAVAGAGNSGLTIAGNLIGSDPNGIVDLGNGQAGIAFYAETSGHMVSGNVVAHNGGAGVLMDDWGIGPPLDIAILGNEMHSNLGTTIDLGANGHTPNDAGDGDSGPNGLQNFPDLTIALVGDASTTVHGTLDSSPETWFRLEFFENPTCGKSGYGEAHKYLGYWDVLTDGAGKVTFKAPLAGEATLGATLAATATPFDSDTEVFGGTSEVSTCVTISQDQDLDGHADLAFGGDDCMDLEDKIHGGAIEYCDGLNNDCDNETDEECCVANCSQFNGYGDDGCGGFCFVSPFDCPDGECTTGENTHNCPQDCCGTCGDDRCADYDNCQENKYNCPEDCGGNSCGNETCDKGENPDNCPDDCLPDMECGDGICHMMEDKFHDYCPEDCAGQCGDCECTAGEDWEACPYDCGVCGDGTCTQCPNCDESDIDDYCYCPPDCTV